MAFTIFEPHPSVPKARRRMNLSTGRGGAGNFSTHEATALTDGSSATGPASRFSISSVTSKNTTSTTTTKQSEAMATEPRPSTVSKKSKSATSGAQKAYSGGIGGAGNFHSANERRIFSFDEELERAQRMDAARNGVPVYHFGRGGAGNLASAVTDKKSSTSIKGGASVRAGSTSSNATDSSTDSRSGRRGLGSLIRGLSTSRE